MEEELNVEERMSAGMGVEVSSGWYLASFSHVVHYIKRKIWTRRVGGGCEGARVGRPLMGCVEDVDGRDFLRVLDCDYASCPSVRFFDV